LAIYEQKCKLSKRTDNPCPIQVNFAGGNLSQAPLGKVLPVRTFQLGELVNTKCNCAAPSAKRMSIVKDLISAQLGRALSFTIAFFFFNAVFGGQGAGLIEFCQKS
jgi:hypothetical protein